MTKSKFKNILLIQPMHEKQNVSTRTSLQLPAVILLAKYIKEKYQVPVIVRGPLATY